MRSHVVEILVLFLGLNGYMANIPDGYILRIYPSCGSDSIEDARVDIITDLRATATAVCESNQEINFNNTDGINMHLHVSYPNRGNSPCVFQKRKASQVYVMEVHVSWGEPDNPIHTDEQEFYVTCTFDENGHKLSSTQHVEESLVAPVEIQNHLGEPSVSNFTITLMDVLGEPLYNSLSLGRLVYLYAVSDGGSGESGIRPVACDAVSSSTGVRYAILRAGCGDGVVFDRNNGFITSGLAISSPYFRAFVMAGDAVIQFDCNFTLCNNTCDGSSCDNEIRQIRATGVRPHELGDHVGDVIQRNVIDVLEKRHSTDDGTTKEDLSEIYLRDVFWVGMLCIGIGVLLAVCLAVCVTIRARALKEVVV